MGRRIVALGLLLMIAGCATSGPPAWVDQPPVEDAFLYGVGMCGPTSSPNPGRAKEIAFARAIEYLGKTIRVSVASSTVLVDTNRSSSFTAESVQFSDEDLLGVEIVQTWEGDFRNGRPQLTYVLVKMPRAQAEAMARRRG